MKDLDAALAGNPFILDLAHGMLYTHGLDHLQPLRLAASKTGGYAIVMDGDGAQSMDIDPWGFHSPNLDLMQAIKERWDPKGLANPGRFVV